MNFLENLTPQMKAAVTVRHFFVVSQQRRENIAGLPRLLRKLVQLLLAAAGKSVTPRFCYLECRLYMSVFLAEFGQCLPNGVRIDVTHYFTDKLFLPAERTVRTRLTRYCDLFDQVVIGVDLSELFISQPDQLFTEGLKCEVMPFSCALAGLCVCHGLSYVAVSLARW